MDFFTNLRFLQDGNKILSTIFAPNTYYFHAQAEFASKQTEINIRLSLFCKMHFLCVFILQ